MEKQSLLHKFNIPIHHLDFKYVEECADAREMEKIVQILRSGEEGYYPDLTRCAEEKLRELKPNSKLFRVEESLSLRRFAGESELKPFHDWNEEVKNKDKDVKEVASSELAAVEMPALRSSGKISEDKSDESAPSSSTEACQPAQPSSTNPARIKSTDYSRWDKYDPDEEMLRQELAEERQKEEIERMNRLNLEKSILSPKITEITEEDQAQLESVKQMSDLEKEKLAEVYRHRGNEYFRGKDYNSALEEYERAIMTHPPTAAAAFNNRAVTYIKLHMYPEAIKDCHRVLLTDPKNLKARLRLAEATLQSGKERESYPLYLKVLELDPFNKMAERAIRRHGLDEWAPPHATRVPIIEIDTSKPENTEPTTNATKSIQNSPKISSTETNLTESSTAESASENDEVIKEIQKAPAKEYDLAELIKPNRIVKNRWARAAEALARQAQQTPLQQQAKSDGENMAMQPEATEPQIFLQQNPVNKGGKVLIEELS